MTSPGARERCPFIHPGHTISPTGRRRKRTGEAVRPNSAGAGANYLPVRNAVAFQTAPGDNTFTAGYSYLTLGVRLMKGTILRGAALLAFLALVASAQFLTAQELYNKQVTKGDTIPMPKPGEV